MTVVTDLPTPGCCRGGCGCCPRPHRDGCDHSLSWLVTDGSRLVTWLVWRPLFQGICIAVYFTAQPKPTYKSGNEADATRGLGIEADICLVTMFFLWNKGAAFQKGRIWSRAGPLHAEVQVSLNSVINVGLRPQLACVCWEEGRGQAACMCFAGRWVQVSCSCRGHSPCARCSGQSASLRSWVLCVISSLQGLLSAVDDLLNKLLESEDPSLLGVYVGSVMPDHREWEKMRQSLPKQVCLRLESTNRSEVWISCKVKCINFWRRKASKWDEQLTLLWGLWMLNLIL